MMWLLPEWTLALFVWACMVDMGVPPTVSYLSAVAFSVTVSVWRYFQDVEEMQNDDARRF